MNLVEVIVVLIIVSILAVIVLPQFPFSIFWFAITIASTLMLCAIISLYRRQRPGAAITAVLALLLVVFNAPTIFLMRPLSYTLAEQEYKNATLSEILIDQAARQDNGLPFDFRMQDGGLANSRLSIVVRKDQTLRELLDEVSHELGCQYRHHWRGPPSGGGLGTPYRVQVFISRSMAADYAAFVSGRYNVLITSDGLIQWPTAP